MDPFASVAAHYDYMVDWPSRLEGERPFFAELVRERPVRRALDVGCGTGHHSRLLAELGAEVLGIDPSAPMLARARALTPGDNPRFQEGGFDEIPTLPGPFDLIVILGNTLAYVDDAADLTRTLADCHAALTPDGRLCLQVVNYSLVQAKGSHWMPMVNRVVDGREYLFLREYRAQGDYAEFTLITLIRDGAWQRLLERSRHYALPRARLEAALREAGFRSIRTFSDFQRSPFDEATAGFLVVLAEK